MNRKFKLLLLVELIITAVFALILFIGRSGYSENVPIEMGELSSEQSSYTEEEWIEETVEEQAPTPETIRSAAVALPKGTYTIDVWYSGDQTQTATPVADGLNSVFLEGSEFYLNKNLNHVTYSITAEEDIDNFQLQINYNGSGSLDITNIQITENNNGQKLALLSLITVFLLLDLILIFRTLPPEKKFTCGAIVGITILSSLPLLMKGINDVPGHDMEFHLMRIDGIAGELRAGHFPVRISSEWAGGYGYPVSIFYGDVFLYIPAVLRLWGMSMTGAYKVFVLVINLLSSAVSVFCFSSMFKSRKTGALTALAYMTATYRLVDVYIRTAVGEYSAVLFFPIIALALWNIYKTKNGSLRNNLKNGIILAIGMTGVITTHILSSEMTALAIFVVFVLVIKKSVKLSSIRTYIIGVLGTLLLSAFFLVPFMDYMMNVPVKIFSSVQGGGIKAIQEIGVNWGDFFSFFSNPFRGGRMNGCTPGLLLMLALVIAVIMWIRGKASATVKILSAGSLLMLFMATYMFPWNSLASHYSVFNFLAQVQFPWRYVILAVVFQSVLFGTLLQEKVPEQLFSLSRQNVFRIVSAAGIFAAMLFLSFYVDNAFSSVLYDTQNLNTYNVFMSKEYVRTLETPDGFYECDFNLLTGLPETGGAEYANVTYRNGTDVDIAVKTAESPAMVEAPLVNYKGFKAFDDSGQTFEVVDSDNLLVSFAVPQNYEGTIHIRFKTPWIWNAAIVCSAATALAMGFYLYSCQKSPAGKSRRKRRF